MGIYLIPNLDEATDHTKRPNRKRECLVEDLADTAMGVYPIRTKHGTIHTHTQKTEKETDLLRILLMQPREYTQFG